MRRFLLIGVTLTAVFAVGALVVVPASAVTFLLAEWLVNGAAVTAELSAETTGALLLEDSKAPVVGKTAVLCSGILMGWVGPNSLDWVSEMLTLAGVAVSTTPLTGTALECTAQTGCETSTKPLVWIVGLGWETEAELMEDGTETFFVDLFLPHSGGGNPGWEISECLVFGVSQSDECTAVEVVSEFVLSGSESLAKFSNVFTELAGAKLATCTQGGAESGVIEGEGAITLKEGGELSLSSNGASVPSAPPGEEQSGAGPNPGAPTLVKEECGKAVDCATGNESEQQTDISIGGRGPGLRVVRSYNGLAAAEASEAGVWGFGWSGPYSARLVVNEVAETATVHQDNGSTVVFYKFGSEYRQGGWDQARLEKSGENYIYTLPDQSKLEFNKEGRLTRETERNGNSNTLTYNASKQVEKVEDGDSRTLKFAYNAEGLVESVTDPLGHVVKYTYSSKQLASVTIEGKTRWEFEYASLHLLTKIKDGRGHVTTNKYDEHHRVTEQSIAGHVRKWSYNANPSTETTLTEPNGSETVDTFNTAGEPTKIVRAKGVVGVETTTEYEYEAGTYARTKLIDPNAHATKYTYDANDNKISETDPNGDERKWEYDAKHNVIKKTTPEGETTTITRNEHGEPEKVERPVGTETQKTEYKYGTHGELTEEIDPLLHATKYTYDLAGDKETEKDPEGDERKWKYNSDSQVTEETSPRGFTTKIERDEQGRPKKITDPLTHTTEYKYDGNGNIESETDGNLHTTKYEYNEENLRTKVTEPNGTAVETGYDSEGRMTSHKDGNLHTWEYKRNQLEQVTEEVSPLLKTTKKKYEKTGDLETLEDPEKHTTTYKYDASNRLTSIVYSTGKPSEVTFEYNKESKVTKMKDETGVTENTWDKLDRLTAYKSGAGKTVKYEYNLNSQPTKIEYPNAKSVTRAYDKAGRLESVTDWNSKVTSFKYNADSQLTATTFPTGTENEDTYAYNEADQTTEVLIKGPLGVTLGKLVYERDGDGQVKKTTTTALPGPEINESVYDENNRLIEANKQAYEYDQANNPTKVQGKGTYTYNEADQLKEGPEAVKYAYNEDGRRTETKPATGPATTYAYDQAGNLSTVKREHVGEVSEINDSYTYDGNSLRQSQTINGAKTNLTWDTAEPLPIILEDETNNYIYGLGGQPIEQIATNGETLYLHDDQQRSTRLLTNSTGEKVGAYTYNPYGTTLEHTGTATTPLGYDGQYTSTDTGLIYLRARTYDPTTAQFLTVDPTLAATNEPYAYSGDNPLNSSDITGKRRIHRPNFPVSGSGVVGLPETYAWWNYGLSGGYFAYGGQIGSNSLDVYGIVGPSMGWYSPYSVYIGGGLFMPVVYGFPSFVGIASNFEGPQGTVAACLLITPGGTAGGISTGPE
jgi:RHS repeat-associated protein